MDQIEIRRVAWLTIEEYFFAVDGIVTGGVTDNLARINAKILEASNAGGGMVLLPRGTIGVSGSIEYRSNVGIMGAGRGATIVKLMPGSTLTSSHGVIQPLNYGVTALATGYYTKNNYIGHLSVDGNNANNSGTYEGIVAAAVKNCVVEDCEVYGATEAGIHGQRHALGTDLLTQISIVSCVSHDNVADGFQISGAVCTNCYAYSNSGYGFNSVGNYSSGGDLTDIISMFVNCAATYNVQGGFASSLQIGSAIRTLIDNCLAHHNTGSGVVCADMNGVHIANIDSQFNTAHGVYIRANGVTVSGGVCNSNTVDGVYLDGTRTAINISSVRCAGNVHGVTITDPTSGSQNVIQGCNLSSNTTSAVNGVPSTADKYRVINCLGFNPVGPFGTGSAPSNPSVPATTVAMTNVYGYPIVVAVAGGTVSAIAVGGTATGLTSGTFLLGPGETITPTYAVAPTTWQLYGK